VRPAAQPNDPADLATRAAASPYCTCEQPGPPASRGPPSARAAWRLGRLAPVEAGGRKCALVTRLTHTQTSVHTRARVRARSAQQPHLPPPPSPVRPPKPHPTPPRPTPPRPAAPDATPDISTYTAIFFPFDLLGAVASSFTSRHFGRLVGAPAPRPGPRAGSGPGCGGGGGARGPAAERLAAVRLFATDRRDPTAAAAAAASPPPRRARSSCARRSPLPARCCRRGVGWGGVAWGGVVRVGRVGGGGMGPGSWAGRGVRWRLGRAPVNPGAPEWGVGRFAPLASGLAAARTAAAAGRAPRPPARVASTPTSTPLTRCLR
jgi:hypothetical protein